MRWSGARKVLPSGAAKFEGSVAKAVEGATTKVGDKLLNATAREVSKAERIAGKIKTGLEKSFYGGHF